MKKLFAIIFTILVLCSCGTEPPAEMPYEEQEQITQQPEGTSEEGKVIWTIDGADYEVDVPAKTRLEVYEGGQTKIITPSIAESPVTVDLSGLDGCEYITSLFVTLMSETESLILPKLPNISGCQIDGNNPGTPFIDAKGIEGCEYVYINVVPSGMEIGKGPETLELGYGIDLGMVSDSENVKMVMLHGATDLSKVAEIGAVEGVYLVGEGADIGGLENLPSLIKLSFHYYNGDMSAAENLSMEVLVFGNETTQESVDTFTYSETVYELHLNDETMTNLDIIDKLPNLQVLLLSVDPIQPAEVPIREEITDESQINALETNLPKEKLLAFYRNGGMIFIMDDWSRT